LAQPRIGQAVDDLEYLALVLHNRAPPRFGRMRGKHRLVQQAVEQSLQFVLAHPLIFELLYRVIE